MITQIGLTAGDVWNHLEACNGSDSFENILKTIGAERDILLMSIGWLAREGHIYLENVSSGYNVNLISKETSSL